MLQARGRDRRQPPRRRRGSPPRPWLLPGRVPRQPVTPYTVDEQLHDSQILSLGDAEWQVIGTPGHTPGHLCLWQPDERPLIAGDSLPDDVGWVSTALDGPDATATALACLELCLVESRAEPEHLRAGSTSW
jgi:glyoxylase-like metal-dependent hydrolase (beta-lactamase superfamily II)